jgi:chemotaxis-related protein WspD
MLITDLKINDCWNRIGIWSKGTERCPELTQVVHCRNCPVFSESGRSILRTKPHEDYRSEWTGILALPAEMIQEIVPMGPIHSLPNISSRTLRGLVNVHGRLQICVSIGSVLGIEKLMKTEEERDPNYISPERLVVVLQETRLVAFPVSETKGIVRYTPEMVQDLPVTVSGSKAVYTIGVLHLDGKDIGLLKDRPLFKTLTKNLE